MKQWSQAIAIKRQAIDAWPPFLPCATENYCRGLDLLTAHQQELTPALLNRLWKTRGQQLLRAAQMLHVSL
jgi:hypothetical protein